MKWTYSIKNKLAASAVLFSLCLLVLFSNFIDRNHTKNVKNAIKTLYEDRLKAEEYILEMTNRVYQLKEVIKANNVDEGKINSINNLFITINKEHNAYLKTKFTESEKIKADELFKLLGEIKTTQFNNEQRLESVNKALIILNELSAIQISESEQIMDNAETLYQTGKAASQFVFALIIIILIVLQALVFTSTTLLPVNKTKLPHLN